MKCHKCPAPMRLLKVIAYRSGPSKAMYECNSYPNHVRILDVPDEPPGTHLQADVPKTPLATEAGGAVIERRGSC